MKCIIWFATLSSFGNASSKKAMNESWKQADLDITYTLDDTTLATSVNSSSWPAWRCRRNHGKSGVMLVAFTLYVYVNEERQECQHVRVWDWHPFQCSMCWGLKFVNWLCADLQSWLWALDRTSYTSWASPYALNNSQVAGGSSLLSMVPSIEVGPSNLIVAHYSVIQQCARTSWANSDMLKTHWTGKQRLKSGNDSLHLVHDVSSTRNIGIESWLTKGLCNLAWNLW